MSHMETKWEEEPLGIAQNPGNPEVVWRIYYADYTRPNGYYTVSNLESDPTDVPEDGIICIVQNEPDVNSLFFVTGGEFYFINESGKWQAGFEDDSPDGYAVVKKGYWIDDETFNTIQRIAHFDTDFFHHIYPAEQMEQVFVTPVGIANNPVSDVLWRIYYADHTAICNLDCSHGDAPTDDVVCILQYEDDQEIDVVYNIDFEPEIADVRGDVFFINEYGRWQGGFGSDTLVDRDARQIPYSSVKNGFVNDLDLCRTIIEGVGSDTDFPGCWNES